MSKYFYLLQLFQVVPTLEGWATQKLETQDLFKVPEALKIKFEMFSDLPAFAEPGSVF